MSEQNGSSSAHYAGTRLEDITANHVSVERSAVRRLEADQAQLERAAVQRMRASQATFEHSSVAFASFEQGTLRQSNAGVVVARSVACDEVRTFVLAAPVVRGEVHTMLDMRSAVAVGVGIVLGKVIVSGVRKVLRA